MKHLFPDSNESNPKLAENIEKLLEGDDRRMILIVDAITAMTSTTEMAPKTQLLILSLQEAHSVLSCEEEMNKWIKGQPALYCLIESVTNDPSILYGAQDETTQ